MPTTRAEGKSHSFTEARISAGVRKNRIMASVPLVFRLELPNLGGLEAYSNRVNRSWRQLQGVWGTKDG